MNLVTGKNHPQTGKSLCVEKLYLKRTKNRFFGHGMLTAYRIWHFSTTNFEYECKEVYNAKNYLKNFVYWSAHYLLLLFLIDTNNYWIFDENYTFFGHLIWMDNMIGIVKEDILKSHFGNNWSCMTNGKADTSTERIFLSKQWHKRVELKRNFLVHFPSPVLSVDTTEIIYSYLM